MMTHVGRAVDGDASATFWLDSLKKAHSDMLDAIEELAELTRGPVPDKKQLVGIRWRVSDASLIRRLLWGRIHAFLAQYADADAQRDLRALQDADIRLIRQSAKHVANWTTEAVIDDWSGYRGASGAMRGAMIDAINLEKRLLYPILQSIETGRRGE